MLTRIKMEMDLLERLSQRKKTIPTEEITAIAQLVNHSMQTTRRIATTLHPKILDQFGLLSALEWQAAQFKNHFACVMDARSHTIRMNEDREIMLFRIGQEAITNVARHAQASLVKIAFFMEKETILLTVEDDGHGMPHAQTRNRHSMGIKGMQERAMQLRGVVQFSPSDSGGLLVTLTVPKQPNDRIEEVA